MSRERTPRGGEAKGWEAMQRSLESSLPGVAAWRGGQAGQTSKLRCPMGKLLLFLLRMCSYLNDFNFDGNR